MLSGSEEGASRLLAAGGMGALLRLLDGACHAALLPLALSTLAGTANACMPPCTDALLLKWNELWFGLCSPIIRRGSGSYRLQRLLSGPWGLTFNTCVCVSSQVHAADWLWLHAPARTAFLIWRSPRDGATATAAVLRIWCRTGGAEGRRSHKTHIPCATDAAPDSGMQALADSACGIRSQSTATASAPDSSIQALADGACGMCSQSRATASAPGIGVQAPAENACGTRSRGRAASCGAQAVGAGGACG